MADYDIRLDRLGMEVFLTETGGNLPAVAVQASLSIALRSIVAQRCLAGSTVFIHLGGDRALRCDLVERPQLPRAPL